MLQCSLVFLHKGSEGHCSQSSCMPHDPSILSCMDLAQVCCSQRIRASMQRLRCPHAARILGLLCELWCLLQQLHRPPLSPLSQLPHHTWLSWQLP